jgi:nucleoside-diphosphate-sugar epimerase
MKVLVTGGSGFIGTTLVDRLLSEGHEVLNVDIRAPKIIAHARHWRELNILDEGRLSAAVREFAPTVMMHLAARTDTEGRTLADYDSNTRGTASVLSAIRDATSVERTLITSTQYVNQYSGEPKHDLDFAPHTVYGESKVITEQLTRQARLPGTWTITRPTNIWGAWHPRYPHEFWRVLSKGLYVHPGGASVIRAYGYVKNVVHQILALSHCNPQQAHARVFYLGDEPIDLFEWVNGFSLAQTGRPVRVVPARLLRLLAISGDALKRIRVPFPLTSSRFKNMTTSNAISMQRTFEVTGPSPYTLQAGIAETVAWLRTHHPDLVTVK